MHDYGAQMTLNGWLTLISGAGQLGLALVAVLRGQRSRLALPLAYLCMGLFSWNVAALAHQVSGDVGWRYLDVATSPLSAPLALHFVLVFVGKRRDFAWVLFAAYACMGLLGAVSLSAFVSPAAASFAGSPAWALLHLAGIVPIMGFLLHLLVVHLRLNPDAEEQMRTRLVLAGMGLGTLLASTELFADVGFAVPRGGHLAALAGTSVLAVVTFRFRLLESEMSRKVGAYALGIGGLAVIAYLAVFYFFAASTAMLAFGTITVTLVVLAAVRQLAIAVSEHRQRMEALAALGRFSAQMAHDLKNPLAALKGAVQYLKEEHTRKGTLAGQEDFFDLLLEQVERMTNVVDKYQRLGRVEPTLAPCDINGLIRDVVALQSFATNTHIVIRTEFATELPRLYADRDLLSTAVENLIRNAMEAMPEGGTVTVSTERLRRTNGDDKLVISVADTGEAMDARTQERAFDDFYTTKASGSGMGLSYVQRVARAHCGAVTISSRSGVGTLVRLALSLETAALPESAVARVYS